MLNRESKTIQISRLRLLATDLLELVTTYWWYSPRSQQHAISHPFSSTAICPLNTMLTVAQYSGDSRDNSIHFRPTKDAAKQILFWSAFLEFNLTTFVSHPLISTSSNNWYAVSIFSSGAVVKEELPNAEDDRWFRVTNSRPSGRNATMWTLWVWRVWSVCGE